MWTQIGKRIRQLRVGRELSQSELAEKAELSLSLVSKLEAGHKGAKLESLQRLAEALDVSLAEMLPHPVAVPNVKTGPVARASDGKTSGSWDMHKEEHKRLMERTKQLSKRDLQVLSYLAQLMSEAQRR